MTARAPVVVLVDVDNTLLDNDAASGHLYNVGSTTEVPVIELARRVIDATGSTSKIRLIPYEHAYGEGFEELGRRKPETRAIRELTGWAPSYTVGALCVVRSRARDGIPCIAQLLKLYAFDDAAGVDVEAGNDAATQHVGFFRRKRAARCSSAEMIANVASAALSCPTA